MDDKPEGMAKVPEAISKRSITVQTGRGAIVVEKWSITRFTAITTYLAKSMSNVSEGEVAVIIAGGTKTAAGHMISALGERIPGMIELCVRESDRDKIADMDAEDGLSVFDAAIELNLTPGLVGKVKALWLKFRSRLQGAEAKPSTPSS